MLSLSPHVGRLFRFVLPVAILAAGGAGLLALNSLHEPALRPPEEHSAPLVETIVLATYEGGLHLDVDGLVVPFREAELSAEVSGRIVLKSAACRAGRFVAAGDLLVEIDPRDYELEVRRLTKEREQAEVSVQELDVEIANTMELVKLEDEDLQLQRKDLERLRSLAEDKLVTSAELDRAKQRELAARNAMLMAENQFRLLTTRRNRLVGFQELVQAQLEQAELKLSRARVTAPFAGVIVREEVEQDDYVREGTPLVVIEDTSAIEVKCLLRMEEVLWLWQHAPPAELALKDRDQQSGYSLPNLPVTVAYRLSGREYSWAGRLDRYDGIGLDEKTRTVPCRVVVDQPRQVSTTGASDGLGPRALVRGMFVAVRIHAEPNASLVRIPNHAVQPGGVVWRVRDGQLQVLPIHPVKSLEDAVLVEDSGGDLAAGDKVAVSPLVAVEDGMAVRESTAP